MKAYKIFTTIIAALLIMYADGQPYEIRTVNKGEGIIGVEMRVTGGAPPTTGAFITDLVFGLKWLGTYNVDLVNTITTSYNIKKSDVRKFKNNYYYQAFYVDNTPLTFPGSWTVNNWVEIMSIANTRTGIGVGDFAIAENGFDVTTNPNIGVNLTDYTPAINSFATGVLLPIKLISFNAVPTDKCKVNITWQTAQEVKTAYFIVERSSNNVNYAEVDRVYTSQNESAIKTYESVDDNSLSGISFYRLRAMDIDGKFTYSEVKEVKLNCHKKSDVRIYPTITNGLVNVKLPSGFEDATIKVINAVGEVVAMDMSKTLNRTISLSKLTNGTYLIQVVNNNDMRDNVKVILQH